MITFILWFAFFIILGLLGYHLVTFVIMLISEIGDCFMGDNGGIIIWIIIIVGGLVMLLL
jgi:hypothetical protein